MSIGSVGGVIEVDEAFFRESFKDNHKKNTTFTMTRKCHKRGVNGSFSSKTEKRKNLLVQSHTSHTDTKLKGFRVREAIYV
ncbi:hypothetical protein CSC2_38290 [Clostridium zeae]|uniref:Transposase n=1 Tax=Clostridium zeae TaxID=2759022 RepID=A0ABQ1EFI1_9CLOT|nr:hypothetical protein CSC2_38290 [Clostridium zeae]